MSYITIMAHSKTLRKPKSSEIAHTGVIQGVLLVLQASHSHPSTPCLLIRITPLFAFSDFLDKCLDRFKWRIEVLQEHSNVAFNS